MSKLDTAARQGLDSKKYYFLVLLSWTVLISCIVGWSVYRGFYLADEDTHTHMAIEDALVYGIIWLVGVGGIIAAIRRMARYLLSQRKAEVALRDSQARQKVLTDNLPQRIFHKDAEGCYVSCNAHYASDLGISPDEIVGKTDFDFHPTEHAEKYRADDMRLMDSDQIEEIEEKYIKDGQEIIIQTVKTPVLDEDGNSKGILGIFWDITDRKRSEEKLRISEERFSKAFRCSPNTIMLSRLSDGLLIDVNEAYEEMYGRTRDEVIGRTTVELGMWADPNIRENVFHPLSEGKGLRNVEIRSCRSSGEVFDILLSAEVIEINGEDCVLTNFRDITDRKKAEAAVIESCVRFRELMHQSPVVFELYDLDGLQVDVNAAYEKLWGIPADHTVNKFNVLKSKEVEDTGLMVYVKKAYAGEAVTVPEYEFDSSGKTEADGIGRKRWLSTRIFPLKDEMGQVKNIVISHEDVTDRKEAEMELLAREQQLRAANQQLVASDQQLRAANQQLLANESQLKALEQQLKASNQQLRANEIEREKLVEALGITNQGLQKSEEEFRSTIKDLLVGVVVHGGDTSILLTNPEAENILGLTHDQLTGKMAIDGVWSFVHEDSTVMEVDDYPVSKVFSTKEALCDYVVGVNRPDRDFVTWLTVNAVPALSNDGGIEKVIVNFIDITARKRAELGILAREQQLQASNQQLKANEKVREELLKTLEFKNRELQDIVYSASHDLKSPLVNLSGFSGHLASTCEDLQRLMNDIGDEDSQTKIKMAIEDEIPLSLGFITSSVDKMRVLIDGLLRVSRIGTVDIEIADIDMNALLGEVRGAMEYQLQEHVNVFEAGDLPGCRGDVDLLNQVFTNLIDNAIKYRDPSRDTIIEVDGKVVDGKAVYCVRDNGKGVDKPYQGKVFEIFHRLDPEEDAAGEGLGLTIVTRILDRLGGEIRLESAEGKGCSFYITLPVK